MEITNGQTKGRAGKNGKAEALDAHKPDDVEVRIHERDKGGKPKGATAIIFIPKVEVHRIEIEVEAISPLIIHSWSEKAIKIMLGNQMKEAKQAKEPKDPVADFNGARYLDDKGRDCIPCGMFKMAAVEAGVMVGAPKTTLRKAFFIDGDLLPIKCKGGKPEMRRDMVRLQTGVADIRFRPQYNDWSVKVPVIFQPRLISAEQLYNLFNQAGYGVGIGEWRPQTNGQFGRFRVKTSK